MRNIDDLKNEIKISQESCFGHFEAGRQFHSESYVNLKVYFHDIKTAKILCETLLKRIDNINPDKKPTTFIGFRNYCGNLLSLVCEKLPEYNYYIVESEDDKVVWQMKPVEDDEIKNNVIIILPVSCTSSYIFKVKEFLNSDPRFKDKVSENFINVFMIFHNDFDETKIYSSEEIKDYYQLFNWSEIDEQKTITIHKNDEDTNGLRGFTIVDVYTTLHLTHKCNLCFPDDSKNEKLLHPYHPKYETTKLLDGYPEYVYNTSTSKHDSIFIKRSPENFRKLFFKGEDNVHFYGNIKARGGRYNHYINGNLFYKNNKPSILKHFRKKIESIMAQYERIVFITSDAVNNSSFLEDLLLKIKEINPNIQIFILRFGSQNEFIDSFIDTHKEILIENRTNRLLIYFEEVLSGAGTFKLLSNYIKHYSPCEDTIDENEYNKHGFDYIFTLIDRTALNIEYEVLKKLHSKKNQKPENNFIKFFELNAPVFTSPHMGNPIENEEKIIDNIKSTCNLDAIKTYIIENELIPKKINLPDDLYPSNQDNSKYAHLNLTKSQFNLIKLYCTDVIYNELSELTKSKSPEFDLLKIFDKIIADNNKKERFTSSERLLKDIVLKILTKHPFIHYKNICEKVLEYCIEQLNDTLLKLAHKGMPDDELYASFWSLRFYIKRLVELNSKFIISDAFFNFLFDFYSKNKVYEDLYEMTKSDRYLEDDYQKNQIKNFSAFLMYCYKRLIYNDFGASIKLEELLNKHSYQNKKRLSVLSFETTTEIIKDNYFKLLDMVTLENIYPFQKIYHSIKEEKQQKDGNEKYKSFDLHNYDFFREANNGFEYLDWDKPRSKLFSQELYQIIDSNFRNIKHVLPEKPNYTLIYKYNESEILKSQDNYYYISTRKKTTDNIGSKLKLNKSGFINHLINGIEHNCKTQSFFTILKRDSDFHTFNRHYDYNGLLDLTINESLNVDLNKTGIINNDDNLYFFIRLSEVVKDENEKEHIKGNGVIIISLQLTDINNFFKVIDSKKMRNLLYIRKFFLNKIKPIFESESFLKILKQIETEKIREKFSHGIDDLYKYSILLLEESENLEEIKSLKYPFGQVFNQTKMLLTSTNLKNEILVTNKCNINSTTIKEIFNIYMKLYDVYNKDFINSVKLEDCDVPEFNTSLIFRDIVIPELFYNMGKIAFKQSVKPENLRFSISLKESKKGKFLIIKNPYNCEGIIQFQKNGGGIEVIKQVLKKMNFKKIKYKQNSDEKTVTTKIQISH